MDLEAGEVAEEAVFPKSVESRFQIDRDNDGSLLPLKAVEGLLSNVRQDVGRHSVLLESCLLGRNGFDVAGPLLEPNGDEALHDLGVTRQQRHRMVAFYLARWLSVLHDRNDDRFLPFARCSSFGPTPVDDAQELVEAFVGEVLDHSGVDLVFTSCALLYLLDDVIQLDPAEDVTGRVVLLGSFFESPHFDVSFSLFQPVDLHTAHCVAYVLTAGSALSRALLAVKLPEIGASGSGCFFVLSMLFRVFQTFVLGSLGSNSEVNSFQARFLLS